MHIARFTGAGLMGLGNTFGSELLYSRPQSLLHMSYDHQGGNANEPFGFMQVTYRRPLTAATDIIGQGEQATDGLRLGIDNQTYNYGNQTCLNSYLRWQEASSFIIQTEDNASPSIENSERFRVTSVGALVLNHGTTNYRGITSPSNRTRVSISADGANPVTRPMSLLHLGYNTTATLFTGNGWRPWMDLGTFISSGSDNMYVGLKSEKGNDRQDAVVSWGDNQTTNGPDNMRFIFTAATGFGGGTAPATTQNGLEGMRMTPTTASGVYTGVGGDPTANRYGPLGTSINPTATLEVNSWLATTVPGGSSGLRFTNLKSTSPTTANPGVGVLAVNATGDVIYVPNSGVACWDLNGNGIGDGAEDKNGDLVYDALDCQGAQGVPGTNGTNGTNGTDGEDGDDGAPGPMGPQGPAGTVAANNGSSMSIIDANTVVWGQNIGAGPTGPASLLSTREIPMNNFNVVYTDGNATTANTNNLGIGIATPTARLDIRTNTSVQQTSPLALNVINNQPAANGFSRGVNINVINSANSLNSGLILQASSATSNTGIVSNALNGGTNTGISTQANDGTASNYAVRAVAQSSVTAAPTNVAVEGVAKGGTTSVGGEFRAESQTPVTSQNIGVRASASGTANTNIGLRATASGATTNYAAMFLGDVFFSGTLSGSNNVMTSDQNLKTGITTITNADDVLGQIHPVSFYYDSTDTHGFNFDGRKHYGFIAQEVETVLPELVANQTKPAEYDSLGNQTMAAFDYKTLSYTDFTALLLKGHQEQQAQLNALSGGSSSSTCCDSLATVVANQQDQIDALAAENDQQDAKIASLEAENDAQQGQIDDLNARLTQLENCLSGVLSTLCQMSQNVIEANTPEEQEAVRQQLSVVLSDRNAIILDQNVPNPFAEQTVINFSIPETVVKAQIHFYSLEGKLMQSVDVKERGLGSLTVFGSDLSSGTYTYTLVADGKVVATKKMMKQ